MSDPRRVTGLILAAGAGSRFGGGKMRARLDGRPLVAHVLAAARASGLRRLVLVLGRDAVAVRSAILDGDPAALAGVLVVVNGAPERGLSSSLRIGLAAATADPAPGGVVVLLGDQPRARPEVIAALIAADAPPEALAVAPAYRAGAALNPVLLLPPAWPRAGDLHGDRGFGTILAAGDGVVRVAVPGTNPDVDTIADLAALEGSSRAR